MNKQQRSQTYSMDTYQYSADSQEINNSNQQSSNLHSKQEDTPFQKLRGHSNPQMNQKNQTINTSPFYDNGSQVGLPISYLNIDHIPSQTSSKNNNRFTFSEDANKSGLPLTREQNGYLDQNQLTQHKKQDEAKNNMDILKSNNDTNSFSSNSKVLTFQKDTDDSNSYHQPKVLMKNQYLAQIHKNSSELSNLGYESPLLPRNLSTDCKTIGTNENGSSYSNKPTLNTVSVFTLSPLQQTKQQQLLQQSDNKLKTYQMLQSTLPNNSSSSNQIQKDQYSIRQFNNRHIHSNSAFKNNIIQNENIVIPRVQSSQPNIKSRISNNSNTINQISINNQKINDSNNNSFLNSKQNQTNHQNISSTNISTIDFGNLTNYIQTNNISNNTSYSNNLSSNLLFQNIQKPSGVNHNETKSEINENDQKQNHQITLQKQFTFSQNPNNQFTENQDRQRLNTLSNELLQITTHQISSSTQKPQNKFLKNRNYQQQQFQLSQVNINNQSQVESLNTSTNQIPKLNYQEPLQQKTTASIFQDTINSSRKYNDLDKNVQNSNNLVQELQLTIKNNEREISKIECERNHLQDFVRNMETRNRLLNERIQLLESNLQSLNTQNIENINKIVKLNEQVQEYESKLQKNNSNQKNINNNQTNEYKEAMQRQERLQSEIQLLIQKDLNQEKKILELMSDLTKLESVRNDYANAITEQEILVKNNKSQIIIIDQQKGEIVRLQNIIISTHQDLQATKLQEELSQIEKKKSDHQITKLTEINKNLENKIQEMKKSYQNLEQKIESNCTEIKEWLEKYTTLENNYKNLQKQTKNIDQQNFQMEKIVSPTKRDLTSKSIQSLSKFRSELSETEINFQHQRNKELILSEIQAEREQLSSENDELNQKIKQLESQNIQFLQVIQNLQQSNKINNDQQEQQKKDFMNKINIMIQENNKLVTANQERPFLLQKIQQLSSSLEQLQAQKNTQQQETPQQNLNFNTLYASGLIMQPLPNNFNSANEEIKFYKLRCNQLELKLKLKSEEFADLIYQNKQLKNSKTNPNNNNNEEFSIKSSLYQNYHSVSTVKQACKQPIENPEILMKQFNELEEESQRGCCEKKINKHDNEAESNACSVKCM